MASNRIAYIDSIKGFTILWVVVYHFGPIMPDWAVVNYFLPLFFFMSGIFCNVQVGFKEFMIKRVNTLVVPLLFFFVVSWLFLSVKYELLSQFLPASGEAVVTWSAPWVVLQKLFAVSYTGPADPLGGINNPLWFLVGLFVIQIICYWTVRAIKNRVVLVVGAFVAAVIGNAMIFNEITGLFYLCQVLFYLFYFALGQLFGKELIRYIEHPRAKHYLPLLVVLAILSWVQPTDNPYTAHLVMVARNLCFLPLIFSFFRYCSGLILLRPLGFFGRNSLIVLGTHMLLFGVYGPIVRLLRLFDPLTAMEEPLYYVGLFLFVCAATYPIVWLFNRFFPHMMGRVPLFGAKKTAAQ